MMYNTIDKIFLPSDSTLETKEIDPDLEVKFLALIPERLRILSVAVCGDEQNDFSEKRLQSLQYCISNQLCFNEKNEEQIEAELLRFPVGMRDTNNVYKYIFVEPTLSIAFDCGIYFGEFLRSKIDGLNWELDADEDSALHGHMILRKNNVVISPYQVVWVLTKQIRDGRAKEDRLLELMHIWLRTFERNKLDK